MFEGGEWSEEDDSESSSEEDSSEYEDSDSEEESQKAESASKDKEKEEDESVRLKRHILMLFDRPFEPVVLPKGPNNTVFDIPDKYWVDRYKPHKAEFTDHDRLRNRFGVEVKEVVIIKDLGDKMPDLTVPLSAGYGASYTYLIVNQPHMVVPVIEAFSNGTLEELLSLGCYLRDRYNPYLFVMTLTIALLYRQDTRDMRLPSFIRVFPNLYVPLATLSECVEESFLSDKGSRRPVIVPNDYTSSDDEEEHRLAYFREDFGMNQHHWIWHLAYPNEGPLRIVRKPRRGELFYYMHQQVVARYTFERFSNGMARVSPFSDLREPIKEGYFSKLGSLAGNRTFPGRSANTALSDINRKADNLTFEIKDMEESRDRIIAAIQNGYILTSGNETKKLSEMEGIDVLGNIVESNYIREGGDYYGDLHNLMHVSIGVAHDPDQRHREQSGVIADQAIALRDPAFYHWHTYVNDMFLMHKNSLPSYKEDQLKLDGVVIKSVQVTSEGQSEKNTFYTFWQQTEVDISKGLDFTPRGELFIRFTHLYHRSFTYNIQISNSGPTKVGICRIFLAPKYDERGLSFSFKEQKNLFIEMDKFIVKLKQGVNTIERPSKESSVTIPFERIFLDSDPAIQDNVSFSGCGWPEHLLVPKGSIAGTSSQLFVMVSDYISDQVEDTQHLEHSGHKKSVNFCGLRDNMYPDKRSMGYPFDRMPRDGVDTLADFLTPNMAVVETTIKFTDRVRSPQSRRNA